MIVILIVAACLDGVRQPLPLVACCCALSRASTRRLLRAAFALTILAARAQSRRDLCVSYDVRTHAVRSSRCGERNVDRFGVVGR